MRFRRRPRVAQDVQLPAGEQVPGLPGGGPGTVIALSGILIASAGRVVLNRDP
jgi:hypothetical protein